MRTYAIGISHRPAMNGVSLNRLGSCLSKEIRREDTERAARGRLRRGGAGIRVLEAGYPSPPSGDSLRTDHAWRSGRRSKMDFGGSQTARPISQNYREHSVWRHSF